MKFTYPHAIDNGHGEQLIFKQLIQEPDGDRLLVENFVAPAQGPPMHTHWQQDECLTVKKGKIGYEVLGQPIRYAYPGESVLFKKGVAHRFWNAGEETLHCEGYIKPANTIVFFLSSVFAAMRKSGSERPEAFDAAYLLTRYSNEYDMTDIPPFVKRFVFPATYRIGKLLGKYEHFKEAPEPLKTV